MSLSLYINPSAESQSACVMKLPIFFCPHIGIEPIWVWTGIRTCHRPIKPSHRITTCLSVGKRILGWHPIVIVCPCLQCATLKIVQGCHRSLKHAFIANNTMTTSHFTMRAAWSLIIQPSVRTTIELERNWSLANGIHKTGKAQCFVGIYPEFLMEGLPTIKNLLYHSFQLTFKLFCNCNSSLR